MEIEGKSLVITGRLVRLCRLRDEYYEFVEDPAAFLRDLRSAHAAIHADLFTFIQGVPNREPKFQFHQEWDRAAVLPLTTFEHWWKKQINDKTRNMVRKAQKTGVEIRLTEFNEDFARGIELIYSECPVRQGRPFRHFGKRLEAIRREHGTFMERSHFIGAYYSGQLIGFIKLVYGPDVSNLMNIIAMVSHRDKAPTNGLIAKAVELCCERGIAHLVYGQYVYGNKTNSPMTDFKRRNGFGEVRVPRYYVPLNCRGRLALALGFHRNLKDRLPESLVSRLSRWRLAVYERVLLRSRTGRLARVSAAGQRGETAAGRPC